MVIHDRAAGTDGSSKLYSDNNPRHVVLAENTCLVKKMSTNSSEDLNQQVLIGEYSSVLRQVQIDSDHLFRHLTEVNGKDTRVSLRIDSDSNIIIIIINIRPGRIH